jgi:uncharacterized protein YutE (UPF0331/DUF86 family)
MVLKPEAIRERLLKLEEVISGLEQLRAPDRQRHRPDLIEAWAAERGLQLGAELMFDVGNHILSAHFGVSARDYEDIITQLGARSVIDRSLRDRLRGLGGFRNVLVHGYLRIDPDRVADALARAPRDFSDFARTVREWLDRTA